MHTKGRMEAHKRKDRQNERIEWRKRNKRGTHNETYSRKSK